jgi:hypothetical protein
VPNRDLRVEDVTRNSRDGMLGQFVFEELPNNRTP